MQSFGMFDNKVCSTFKRDRAAKKGFNLFFNSKLVEKRRIPSVKLYNFFSSGSYKFHIFLNLPEDIGIVNKHRLERRIKKISKDGRGTTNFSQDKTGSFN